MVARYSDEHVKTIRERMRNDIRVTLDGHGVDPDIYDSISQWEGLLDDLVADGMYPLEKVLADIADEDLILGRHK